MLALSIFHEYYRFLPLVSREQTKEEQWNLFEEWFLQMFFGFCSPLED